MTFVPQASFSWRTYRRFVRVCEHFFSLPARFPDADILKLSNLPAPLPHVENITSPTLLIDLRKPEEDLWNGVKIKTRKMIRQALRDGIVVEQASELSDKSWDAFVSAYQRLRLSEENAKPLGIGKIRELIRMGAFVITTSREPGGGILSWHTYICSEGHACLLNTVSDAKKFQAGVRQFT